MKRAMPVGDELVENYRKNLQEFNTRSLKKVMEAKARKKRRSKKQLEKVKKKAETILENADHSGQEKIKMLKKLYKKTEKKKEEITYVVAKKGHSTGKKVRRPAGVKGRFKVVDPRLKKDLRGEMKKTNAANKKRGAKGGKGVKGKPPKQRPMPKPKRNK
jgi:AdoMet-dependent rRNA methyltransferase SPB1